MQFAFFGERAENGEYMGRDKGGKEEGMELVIPHGGSVVPLLNVRF